MLNIKIKNVNLTAILRPEDGRNEFQKNLTNHTIFSDTIN
jgi:hypothetical protein